MAGLPYSRISTLLLFFFSKNAASCEHLANNARQELLCHVLGRLLLALVLRQVRVLGRVLIDLIRQVLTITPISMSPSAPSAPRGRTTSA